MNPEIFKKLLTEAFIQALTWSECMRLPAGVPSMATIRLTRLKWLKRGSEFIVLHWLKIWLMFVW